MEDEFALIFRENELGSKGLITASLNENKKKNENYQNLYELKDVNKLRVP